VLHSRNLATTVSLAPQFWISADMPQYCGMQTHCWAKIMKQATIRQPLLSNSYVNKHVPMAKTDYSNNGRDAFYVVHDEML
jgi:hypothetical protein